MLTKGDILSPRFVMVDPNLGARSKLVYCVLITSCDEDGICNTDKRELSRDIYTTKDRISEAIEELIKFNYISIEKEDMVNILKNKNLDGLGYGGYVCEWCGVKTSVLCAHHYPIPKSKGGTETVNICCNCHHEFHYPSLKIKIILSKAELESLNKAKKEVIK